ncbi:T9SS type A sorting domain-containing protein [Chryseolinea sp. H1M3-3]|uniref:T9SS type A sorting domain-containing protein n=1 Tax=Chryseolinea sp. H1M3-3 TaxID=3034144 RepID=UPI0023ED23D8|nr:T9SS type A sorting domain-containing protein [Chryseolinea sp. H1M3-3]
MFNFCEFEKDFMVRTLLSAVMILVSSWAFAQGFEIAPLQESYKASIGETIKVPLRFKNTSEKSITLIIRKVNEQIGSTQKKYFCIDNNCLDAKIEDYIIKVEPGHTVTNFYVALDAGLNQHESTLRYIAYNKSNPSQALDLDLNFNVEEKTDKATIYQSRYITLYDVYPNPAVEQANLSYKLLSDQVKAKVLLHNILGNVIGEYSLSSFENLIRIKTEDLNPGIYFYTLYIESEGVMTRKLIVKK